MPVKVLKLVSDQASPFSRSNNRVDITIPSYLQYTDLSKSCVLLNLKCKKADGTDLGLFDVGFQPGLDAASLIKNCSISSLQTGTIESIAASNVLTQNLKQLTMDFEDIQAQQVYGNESFPVSNNTGTVSSFSLGSFIHKRFLGSKLSEQKTELKIPLSTLFGIAKINQFPNSLFGDLKISLEFEDDMLVINKLFKQTTSTPSFVVTATAGAGTSFIITNANPNPNKCIFYVGQPINISVDGTNFNAPRNIESITYNETTNQHTVNFSGGAVNFSGTANENLVALQGSGVFDHQLDYEINDVEVVVYQWLLSPTQINSLNSKMKKGINLQFQSYKLERVNMPKIIKNNSYHRQFDIEPGCVNVFTMIPNVVNPVAANSMCPLFSRYDGVKSYRWRLNGKDTTNQDVIPLQYLYNDRLLATMSNGYFRVKNLNLNDGRKATLDDLAMPSDATPGANPNDHDPQTFIIPTPIPLSPEQQMLQLRVHQNTADSTGDKILYLYKQMRQQVNLKSNQPIQVL